MDEPMIERRNLDSSRKALFSDCGAFRYELLITWDASLPLVANIGLNPSTATEFKNDPTIRRDIERAARNGFGSFLKLNLFAIRSKDPKVMLKAADPFGEWAAPETILASAVAHRAQMIIAAWGNHGAHRGRSRAVREAARSFGLTLHAYELNGTGEPVHPLYKPYSLQPTVWET